MSVPKNENHLIAERRKKLAGIREQGAAFPNRVVREHKAADLQSEFGEKTKEELEVLDHKVSVAGRIMAKRGPFMVLEDVSGAIQIYASKSAQKQLKDTSGLWDIGDIVRPFPARPHLLRSMHSASQRVSYRFDWWQTGSMRKKRPLWFIRRWNLKKWSAPSRSLVLRNLLN